MKVTAVLVAVLYASLVGVSEAHTQGKVEKIKNLTATHIKYANRRTELFLNAAGLNENGTRTRDRRDLGTLPLLTIPVKFHVIHDGSKGKVSKARVQAQIDVLTAAFRGRTVDESPPDVQAQWPDSRAVDGKIQFVLDGEPNYVENAAWYECGNNDKTWNAIKKATTVDPTKYLNMFTCNGGDTLGSSMFPEEGMAAKDKRWSMMLSDWALPDGEYGADYTGDTAVHELGHFFGLYHTFFEGVGRTCKLSGDDGLQDTPYEREASFGCPVQNSCNNDADHDPIWNFMDYSDDSCMWRFSEQQIIKMHAQIELYKIDLYKRANVVTKTVGDIAGSSVSVALPSKPTKAPGLRTTRATTVRPLMLDAAYETWAPSVTNCAGLAAEIAVNTATRRMRRSDDGDDGDGDDNDEDDEEQDDTEEGDDADEDDEEQDDTSSSDSSSSDSSSSDSSSSDSSSSSEGDDNDTDDEEQDDTEEGDDNEGDDEEQDDNEEGDDNDEDDEEQDDDGYEGDDDWSYDGDDEGYYEYGYGHDDDGYSYDDDANYEESDYFGNGDPTSDDDKTFAAKWGWQKWRALAETEALKDFEFYDEKVSGDEGLVDDATDATCEPGVGQNGKKKATRCGSRDFSRSCQCEESCTFFQDCCKDYTAVCGALKAARGSAVTAQRITTDTNTAKREACKAFEEARLCTGDGCDASAATLARIANSVVGVLFAMFVCCF